MSDLPSFRLHRRLENPTARWDPRVHAVDIRLRPLGGLPVQLRPHSSDVWVLRDTFLRNSVHLPPEGCTAENTTLIWDLGANIGLTMADMAARYPRARIFGVELDEENAELARHNVADWGDRCTVIRGAVWAHDGEVTYSAVSEGEQLGFRAESGRSGERAGRAPALSLESLFERYSPGERIDYVKMDIEGAERDVLRQADGWIGQVSALGVEVHKPYTLESCAEDLEALGFRTTVRTGSHGPVMATRAQLPGPKRGGFPEGRGK